MLLQQEREQIVEYGIKCSEAGLCPGTSGNISAFNAEKGLMAISPSGIDYYKTKPEDVVIMDLDGKIVDGDKKPSSEWGLHSIFYKTKPGIGGVVHTHSIYCTTFAVLGRPIRAVHYAIADAGTPEIPVAPYHLFGTKELAEETIRVCGSGNAVLMANHGVIACGESVAKAFSLAVNLEYAAEIQYRAECIGKPNILTDEQMLEVIGRFKSYGQVGGKKSY